MTSATDELRRLLDERGVEHEDKWSGEITYTKWRGIGGMWFLAHDSFGSDGKMLYMQGIDMTPEQAIAATLGRPKVKKVRWMTYDEHGGEHYYLACSGCGNWVCGDLDCIGEADGPNFCDSCGGEFDGPLLCKQCGELADMEFGGMCEECYWREGGGNDER